MSIKYKLIITYLLAGLLPMTAVGGFIYLNSSRAIHKDSEEKLQASLSNKKEAVENYFQFLKSQILTFSHNLTVVEASHEFKKTFTSYSSENKYTQDDHVLHKSAMNQFFNNEFGKKYRDENKTVLNTEAILESYSENATSLQYSYISQNSNPLGSKHLLDVARDKSRYTQLHKKFHPSFREYLDKYHLYDIFIVDVESGDVVYTVFKEIDFASNLLSGYQTKTGIAEVFQKAKSINDQNTVALVDYKTYLPSYDAPASFIGAPVWDGDKKVAVVIFQVPMDQISLIMKNRAGLGETGESYLVGSDGLLRSDTYLSKDKYNVVNSFKNPEELKITTEAASRATDKTGLIEATNYLGTDVMSSYSPMSVEGIKWGIVAEISTHEAFASIASLKWIVISVGCVSVVMLFALAFFIAVGMSRRISDIASRLSESAGEMAKSSDQISQSSTELSETSTEQAASLQETVSSIDEISSMVQRNADAAGKSAEVSMQSTQVVARGKQTVDNMIDSIADISASNENVIICMQKSNEDISKIVNVISEIGEKTKVINDIVFQTKLLSFNASVEAARAGEHGKGFAVVAEEVGNLASMSGKAALEITEMLDRSIKQVTDIVGQTKSTVDSLVQIGKEKIQVGTKTANDCGRALDEIMKNMVSVNDMVKEIASASEEQATGVKEVTKAMQQLDQTMHQNTSVAQQSSSTAKSIKSQANLLGDLMGELNGVVHGAKTALAKPQPSASSENKKVTYLKKGKSKDSADGVLKAPQKSLKIVGLDTEVPKQDDSRFEEL